VDGAREIAVREQLRRERFQVDESDDALDAINLRVESRSTRTSTPEPMTRETRRSIIHP
jgi:outer membrane lipopolysaccharide assembly protein LptE/RlpB